LHAIVCIKSVPDTTEVRIAIEEALRLREAHGGTVTVMTMGPPQSEKELREALAMGCDEAVFLCAPEFAGSDTWATAYTLSRAITKVDDYDLILCGKQAVDGDTGQVGPGIANQLGIPQLTYVFKIRDIDPDEGTIVVERLLEEGREIVRTRLPALLTVVKDINQPRYPTFRGIRRARKAEIPTWTPADLNDADAGCFGLDGSPTRVIRVSSPPRREGQAELISGNSVEEMADILSDRILAEKVI